MKRKPANDYILLVTVGSDDRPARPEDVNDVKKFVRKCIRNKVCFNDIVTHHCIKFQTVPVSLAKCICVGTEEHPAGKKDIQEVSRQWKQGIKTGVMITGHAVSIVTRPFTGHAVSIVTLPFTKWADLKK